MPVSFDDLIRDAHAEAMDDPGDPRWSAFLSERLADEPSCSAFVDWARHHRKWQFNVADVADRICAKPREAAITILADIVTELNDEEADEAGTESP